MDSASKTRLSFETAQALVTAHFGAAGTLRDCRELTGGYFSAAYRLDLTDGSPMVVKIAPPPTVRVLRYERDILRAEVGALRLIRQRTTVPVPAILAHDDTRMLLPSDYFIMSFVPGQPLHTLRRTLSAEAQDAIDRALGGLLRQMNAIHGDSFGYFDKQPFTSWRAAFDSMLRGVLDDAREIGADLPDTPDALYELLSRRFDCLDEITSPRFVHWDLWDGNVFVDPASGQITGIIDFERALWGDPLMEVNFRDYRDEGAFSDGYGISVRDSPSKRARRVLYNVYLYLIMVTEDVFRQYQTHDITDWARGLLIESLSRLA